MGRKAIKLKSNQTVTLPSGTRLYIYHRDYVVSGTLKKRLFKLHLGIRKYFVISFSSMSRYSNVGQRYVSELQTRFSLKSLSYRRWGLVYVFPCVWMRDDSAHVCARYFWTSYEPLVHTAHVSALHVWIVYSTNSRARRAKALACRKRTHIRIKVRALCIYFCFLFWW